MMIEYRKVDFDGIHSLFEIYERYKFDCRTLDEMCANYLWNCRRANEIVSSIRGWLKCMLTVDGCSTKISS